MAIELEDRRDGAVEKVPVVRDDDQPAAAGAEPGFEATQTFEVEIVGRFIEQGEVETGQLDAGQGHLGPFTPGQCGHRLPADVGGQSELGEHGVGAGIGVGHTETVEPFEGHLITLGCPGATVGQCAGRLGQPGLGVQRPCPCDRARCGRSRRGPPGAPGPDTRPWPTGGRG